MPENYLLKLVNQSLELQGDPTAVLSMLFLFLARILPIISLAPFLGARVAPHPVKIMLALALFVIFSPLLFSKASVPLSFSLFTILLFVKELFIGLLIGLLVSLPFVIVQNAGIFIDHQRGGASLMVNDPTVQNQSSPLGTLFNMVMIYVFFIGVQGTDGLTLFFEALMHSYEIIPADQFFSSTFFAKDTPYTVAMIGLFNQIMVFSIQMATPGLLMILMTDFFLGIINRLAPQVQITFLGMPLKSLLALLVVTIGWHIYATQFTRDGIRWMNYINNMINWFEIGKTVSPP